MIGKQLKLLRELKHKSQQEVCSALNIEQSTLANYENDKRIPKVDILIKLAKYYSVSTDYLLGLTKIDSYENYNNYLYGERITNWNIRKKAEDLGFSYKELLERTGINEERLTLLWFGNLQPFAEELIRFSKALNVSIDYLLDNSIKEQINSKEEIILLYYKQYPSEIMDLLNSFCSLNKKDRIIILGKCFELEQNFLSVAAEESLKRTGTDNLGK